MKPHPDDEIFRVKEFINELSKVQDGYFSALTASLEIPKETEDYLFDYIFNETRPLTFGEYLDGMGKGDLWDGF
jgi:hypothetical protein